MVHRVLYIGNWLVDFLFAGKQYDIEEVFSYVDKLDVQQSVYDSLNDLMRYRWLDSGFTVYDTDKKRMLVVVGPSSSGKQFTNTLVHELHHLAAAIAYYRGDNLRGEGPAYLSGDSVMELSDMICRFGCGCDT